MLDLSVSSLATSVARLSSHYSPPTLRRERATLLTPLARAVHGCQLAPWLTNFKKMVGRRRACCARKASQFCPEGSASTALGAEETPFGRVLVFILLSQSSQNISCVFDLIDRY